MSNKCVVGVASGTLATASPDADAGWGTSSREAASAERPAKRRIAFALGALHRRCEARAGPFLASREPWAVAKIDLLIGDFFIRVLICECRANPVTVG